MTGGFNFVAPLLGGLAMVASYAACLVWPVPGTSTPASCDVNTGEYITGIFDGGFADVPNSAFVLVQDNYEQLVGLLDNPFFNNLVN